MNNNFLNEKRGGILRAVLIIIAVIAVLVYFNIASLEQIKTFVINIGRAIWGIAETAWYQVMVPAVQFTINLASRIVGK